MNREFSFIAICHLPFMSESTPFMRIKPDESVSFVTTFTTVYAVAEAFFHAQDHACRHTDDVPFPHHSSATGGDVLILLGIDSDNCTTLSAVLYCCALTGWRKMEVSQLRAWSMSQPMDRVMPSDEAAFGEELTDEHLLSDLPHIG